MKKKTSNSPLKIIIPSRGRADCVLATKAVNGAILFVAESQAPLYKEHNPDTEIVTHPDEVEIRSYSAKLQWALEYFGNVFQIDDDAKYMQRLYVESGEQIKVDPATATKIVHNTYEMACDIGAYYWGFNTQPMPTCYKGNKPFRFSGMCWGNGCGIRYDHDGCKLFWDADIRTNQDFWMALINAYYHRYALFDDRFIFLANGTFKSKGGAALYRTEGAEKEALSQLIDRFGDAVTKKTNPGGFGKIHHDGMPSLNLPY